jgi:hypothetical protein
MEFELGPRGSGNSGGVVATSAGAQATDEARERLELELDAMRGCKELFLGRFEVRVPCYQPIVKLLFRFALGHAVSEERVRLPRTELQ